MKKKIIAMMAAVVMAVMPALVAAPVLAADPDTCPDKCVKTNILVDPDAPDGCFCKEGKEAVFFILRLIVRVMSGLVMTASVLGIIICGIQYLTARDNESQVVKAKSRLLQVVIGMFVYVLLWVFLEWLIPGGSLHQMLNG